MTLLTLVLGAMGMLFIYVANEIDRVKTGTWMSPVLGALGAMMLVGGLIVSLLIEVPIWIQA